MGVNLKDSPTVFFPGPLNPVEDGINKDVGNPANNPGIVSGSNDLLGSFGSLLGGVVDTVGKILEGGLQAGAVVIGGIVEIGSAIIGGAIDGVKGLFGAVASMMGNIFRRDETPPEPLPDIYSPIAADLEAEMEPFFQGIDEGLANSNALGEAAVAHAQDALDIARAANEAVQDSAGVIRGLVDEGHAAAEEARTKAEEARGHAENALGLAGQASNFADEADRLNEEVKASKLLVDQAVATGRSYVSSAAAQAGLALVSAQEARDQVELARGYNAEIAANVQIAQQAVVDGKAEVIKAKAEVTKAQNASSAAGDALSSAQAVKVDVTASAEEVATALAQVVGYHGEVLQAHGEAINAATAAAGSASTAADKALDAASANTSAISAMQQANNHRDAAINAAADSADQAATAANSAASAAGEALEATRVLGEIAGKQTEINESLSKGVRAAASAAAQASVATMMNSQAIEQVAIATQKALDAAGENASALAAAADAMEKAEQSSLKAVIAQDARDDAQDAVLRLNVDAIQAMQQYITRVMFLPDSSKVNSVNNPHWEATFSNGKRKLRAKPGWVGEWIYHSAVHRSGDFGPVIEGGTVSSTNREFLLDTATSSATLQYTIRPGIPRLVSPDSVSGWSTSARDVWNTLPVSASTHMANGVFTASTTAEHEILFRVGWHATNRKDSYAIRIQRRANLTAPATTVKEVFQVGIGPLLPTQSGYRTQSISTKIPLNKGDLIDFWAKCGHDNADGRLIRDSRIQVSWVAPPSNTSDIT